MWWKLSLFWASNLDSVRHLSGASYDFHPNIQHLINFILDASLFLSFPPMYTISYIDMYRMETKGWICKYEIDKMKNLGWTV